MDNFMNSPIARSFVICNLAEPHQLLSCAAKLLLFVLALTTSTCLFAAIQFQNVTTSAGITHVGESWGASWGDLNADGWPDLYASNHREQRSLYVNNRNGTFTDKVRDVARWRAYPTADTHGAAWGNFNNDGYQDLYVSVGIRDSQELFINESGKLIHTMDPKFNHMYDNVNYLGWEARLPVWFDYNDNGVTDLLMMISASAQVFQQSTAGFTQVNAPTGVKCINGQYGQFTDLTGDHHLELICDDRSLWPSRIYDTSTLPFTDVTSILSRTIAVTDNVLGDFDGNLRTDFFMLIGSERISDAALVNSKRIEAQMLVDLAKEKGFSFQTSGVITLELHWTQRNLSRFYIGAAGVHPTGIGPTDLIKFSLDPANPSVWGMKAHNPATDQGIYVGYDQSTSRWTISVSPGGFWNATYWFIDTTTSFPSVTKNIEPGGDYPIRPLLRMNLGTGFPDQAQTRGLGDPMLGVSAVAADFDNDMDLDLYMVCRGGVINIENRLYENQGAGTFVRVPLAGGAAGFTGVGVGAGESVVTADYDVDGFQDLFVTNGLNMLPQRPYPSRGGPDNLFHNVGNSNKWIELDLVGKISNRDGVGAKIYATAGSVTQLREQNGGYHRWSQNHQRIHFGLATNSLVNLRIEWPSGTIDTYSNVPANHLYKVTEGTGYQEIVLPPPGGSNVAPVITGQVPLSTPQDTALTLVLGNLTVTDPDNAYPADFTLNVQTGANYTVSGTTITPATGFTGTLTVPVTVNDGSANSAVFNLTVSVVGSAPSPCGTPAQSPGTEVAVFVWKNCTTGIWSMRVTAGGGSKSYSGSVDSSQPFSTVTPVSVEANDTLNYTTDPSRIVFGLTTTSTYQDGFDFSFPVSADVCFSVNLPAGATVYVGAARTVAGTSFSLATLGACN